eukprot:14362926-Ditylum_brightwellii.AAC.1
MAFLSSTPTILSSLDPTLSSTSTYTRKATPIPTALQLPTLYPSQFSPAIPITDLSTNPMDTPTNGPPSEDAMLRTMAKMKGYFPNKSSPFHQMDNFLSILVTYKVEKIH